MRPIIVIFLVSAFSLPPSAFSQRVRFGSLVPGSLVVTGELDAAASATLVSATNALHASFTNEALYRAQGDAQVSAQVIAATNALHGVYGPLLVAATNSVAVSHTNLLDHFNILVSEQAAAFALSVASATNALHSASEASLLALLSTNRVTAIHDAQSSRFFQTLENGTATVWQITGPFTHLMVTLSADFSTTSGARPAWTNSLFPFWDDIGGQIFEGVIHEEGRYQIDSTGSSWANSDLDLPATLPAVSGASGSALVWEHVFMLTNLVTTLATTNDLAAMPASLQPHTLSYYADLGTTNTAGSAGFLATNTPTLRSLVTADPAEAQSLGRFRLPVSAPLSGIITATALLRAGYYASGSAPQAYATLSRYSPADALLAADTGDTVAIPSATVAELAAQLALSAPVTNGYFVLELFSATAAEAGRDLRVLTGGAYPLRLSVLDAPLDYLTWSDALALFAPQVNPTIVAPTFASSVTLAGETITNWPTAGLLSLTNGLTISGGWSNVYPTVTIRWGTTNFNIVIKAPE